MVVDKLLDGMNKAGIIAPYLNEIKRLEEQNKMLKLQKDYEIHLLQENKSMIWRDLKTDPPSEGLYCVVLFPLKSDCGILYNCSNVKYALMHGVKNGYTHWMEFPLAPDHNKWIKWQDELE